MTAIDYSFVTTCKGRLHHLKETLPLMIATRCAAVVVVDYNCPDQTAAWVEENYPQVTVVRVTDDDGFSLPRARNIGAAQAKSQWIVFIDADVRVQPGWDDWVAASLQPGAYFRAGPVNGRIDAENYGTFVCERSAFERTGGYDESFSGWGGEDQDIYNRLQAALLLKQHYPGALMSAISHGDDERTRYTDIKSIQMHHIIHEVYMQAKYYYAGLIAGGTQLPLAERKRLMAHVTGQVLAWDRKGRPSGASIRFSNRGTRSLPSSFFLAIDATINIAIVDRQSSARADADDRSEAGALAPSDDAPGQQRDSE